MEANDKFSEIEAELKTEVRNICTNLEKKYGDLDILMNLHHQGRAIVDELERVEQSSVEKLGEVETLVKNYEEANRISQIADLASRKTSCSNAVEFLNLMKKIEEMLCTLRGYNGPQSPIEIAHILIQCKDHLQEISSFASSTENALFDMSLPIKHFSSEYAFQNFEHRYKMSTFYDDFVSLPKLSKKTNKPTTTEAQVLRICTNDPDKISEYVTAINMIGQLEERLKIWSTALVDVFCAAIVASKGEEDLIYISKVDGYVTLKLNAVRTDVTKKMDAEKVLACLEDFLTNVANALQGIEIKDASGKRLIAVIGAACQDAIIDKILKECFAIAAPVKTTGEEDKELLLNLIARGETFVNTMKELNFFAPHTSLFERMDEVKLFVDRRCFAILSRAKEIILQNYTQTVVVGSGGEEQDGQDSFQSVLYKLNASKTRDDELISKVMCNDRDALFPLSFKLLKCTVSSSVVDFAKLVYDTILVAAEAKDNEMLRERLVLTVRNIVQLYTILSSRHHGHLFDSVPHLAALFFNNCYYLAHRLMVLSEEVFSKIGKTFCESMLTGAIPKLREAAADCLESTLTRSKRDLAALLDNPAAFEFLPRGYKLTEFPSARNSSIADETDEQTPPVVKSLTACIMHITSMANIFREVLTEVVYCKTIGALVSFVLSSVTNRMTSACDIRENDGNALSSIFEQLLKEADVLLEYRGYSRVPEFCGREYFRLQEVIFCLGGSLKDVETRWCGGKGPLAEWLSRDEVRRMIVAMFAESPIRQNLLSSL